MTDFFWKKTHQNCELELCNAVCDVVTQYSATRQLHHLIRRVIVVVHWESLIKNTHIFKLKWQNSAFLDMRWDADLSSQLLYVKQSV